jgi:hypothetical protein
VSTIKTGGHQKVLGWVCSVRPLHTFKLPGVVLLQIAEKQALAVLLCVYPAPVPVELAVHGAGFLEQAFRSYICLPSFLCVVHPQF